ncbi:MAG: VOC family protein [Phycisphaerales bacterium JB043]
MSESVRVSPFLSTRDIDRTVAFYRDHLGFTIETLDPPDAPTLAVLDRGDATLIFDSTLWSGEPNLTGQIYFDLSSTPPADQGSDELDLLCSRLGKHTTILWGPETFEYGRREFSCLDPNGYALVFSVMVVDS